HVAGLHVAGLHVADLHVAGLHVAGLPASLHVAGLHAFARSRPPRHLAAGHPGLGAGRLSLRSGLRTSARRCRPFVLRPRVRRRSEGYRSHDAKHERKLHNRFLHDRSSLMQPHHGTRRVTTTYRLIPRFLDPCEIILPLPAFLNGCSGLVGSHTGTQAGSMSELSRKADQYWRSRTINEAQLQGYSAAGIYRPEADLWLRSDYGLSVHTVASASRRFTILQPHPYHLVASPFRPIPGAMLGGESIGLVLHWKLASVVESDPHRCRMCLDQHVGARS